MTRRIFWLTTTVLIYLVSRIYAMTQIPVFLDEAIHLDWARPSLDSMGAPPGFQGRWLTIKLFSLVTALRWPFHDLLAARLVVVLIGLSTALACYLVARELFSSQAGVITVALYLVLPFTLIYTSLAMTDGIELALAAWAILLSVRLTRSKQWSDSILLPLVITCAALFKFSGLLLAVVPVVAILVLAPREKWLRLLLRAALAVMVPFGLILALRRLGMLQIMEDKMVKGSVTLGQAWTNLIMTGNWLWGLLTPVIVIFAGVGIILLSCKRTRPALFVVALLLITILPYVIFAESWYPRYLLISAIPLMLAVSEMLTETIVLIQRQRSIPQPFASVIVVAAVLLWPTLRSGAVLFDLPRAGLPEQERYQLVTGWPSGYGVQELAGFLQEQSQTTKGGIAVARLHWWDQPLQGLNVYLSDSPALSLYTIDYREHGILRTLAHLSTRRRTLLVLSTEQGMPTRLPEQIAPVLKCGHSVWSYTRPGNITGLVVLELACGELAT